MMHPIVQVFVGYAAFLYILEALGSNSILVGFIEGLLN